MARKHLTTCIPAGFSAGCIALRTSAFQQAHDSEWVKMLQRPEATALTGTTQSNISWLTEQTHIARGGIN